jgi:hypothetical protein
MCLHTVTLSGQLQWRRRWLGAVGKSEAPAWANTSSMSRGISPARRLAARSGRRASAAITRSHAASESGARPIVTR